LAGRKSLTRPIGASCVRTGEPRKPRYCYKRGTLKFLNGRERTQLRKLWKFNAKISEIFKPI